MAAHAVVKELSDERSVISIDFPRSWCPPLLFTTDEQIIHGMLGDDSELNMYTNMLISRMEMTKFVSFINLRASARAGLEMALLSLAMVCYLKPSSAIFAETLVPREGLQSHIPINGLLIPSSINSVSGVSSNAISYLSMKVKVGHQRVEDDAIAVMLEECMFGQMATEDRTNLMLNNFTQLLGKHDLH